MPRQDDMDLIKAADENLLEHLRDLRGGLLRLHKALLDAEKICYERENGRIRSTSGFLELIMNDDWFAWLRPLAGLVIQMDESLEGDFVVEKRVKMLIELTTVLLRPKRLRTEFLKRIRAHIQDSPEVAMAFGAVSQLLGDQTTQ
ncbi:MAG: hypothetical protein V1798_02215 [Pseudomonadota bacterium]